jgi:hypothetical protein
LDPRFAGSNPTEDDGFLRAIKIRSTTSFEEVKPSVPCMVLRYVKEPYIYERYILRRQNSADISSPCFSFFATICLLVIAKELYWTSQEGLEIRWGAKYITHVAVQGSPCVPTPQAVPLHTMVALGGRGIAPTHS